MLQVSPARPACGPIGVPASVTMTVAAVVESMLRSAIEST